MTSLYTDIYSSFLNLITDYDLINTSAEDFYSRFKEMLHSVVAQPYIHSIFSSVVLDDEIASVIFTLNNTVNDGDELDDEPFVREVLAKAMVVKWLEPKLKSTTNIMQGFMGKEQKFYAQSSHISALQSLYEETKISVRKMIRDHGYINNEYVRGN